MDIRPIFTNVSNITESSSTASGRSINPNSLMRPNQLNKSQEIQEMINNSPDVRTEKVEEAKALIADPSFPSDEIIGEISRLMISNIAE